MNTSSEWTMLEMTLKNGLFGLKGLNLITNLLPTQDC